MSFESHYLQVAIPVANLRRARQEAAALPLRDELQETQLLLNESLKFKEEKGDWCYVEAVEQPQFNEQTGWHGYPGWVQKKDVLQTDECVSCFNGMVTSAYAWVVDRPDKNANLIFPVSFGTRVSISEESPSFLQIMLSRNGISGWVSRKQVIRENSEGPRESRGPDAASYARRFLGTPYLWGGRSMPMPWPEGPAMGVDCSALVNLAYRTAGIDLPRNAQDQWMISTDIDFNTELHPGDLIFISQENEPHAIVHVMLSLGQEEFIEASKTGDIVRVSDFSRKFGLTLGQLKDQGLTVDRRTVYCRRIADTTTKEEG